MRTQSCPALRGRNMLSPDAMSTSSGHPLVDFAALSNPAQSLRAPAVAQLDHALTTRGYVYLSNTGLPIGQIHGALERAHALDPGAKRAFEFDPDAFDEDDGEAPMQPEREGRPGGEGAPPARPSRLSYSAGVARGDTVIKCSFPLNVLKDTYDHSFY